MKKTLLIVIALLVCLTGCRKQTDSASESEYTAPTLPEFDESLTPEEHLNGAIEKLEQLDGFQVSYGSGWQEELTLTTGTIQNHVDALRALVPNGDLIRQFGKLGMMVIPSNDGTFCYQVTGLTLEETCRLVCGREPTEQERSAGDASQSMVQIAVDAEGIFESIRLEVELDDRLWLLQITIH